jgi:hypothetical protein
MEVEPTSFPFSRLPPSLCVFKPVYLSEPTCAQLTTRAPELNVESQQGIDIVNRCSDIRVSIRIMRMRLTERVLKPGF